MESLMYGSYVILYYVMLSYILGYPSIIYYAEVVLKNKTAHAD